MPNTNQSIDTISRSKNPVKKHNPLKVEKPEVIEDKPPKLEKYFRQNPLAKFWLSLATIVICLIIISLPVIVTTVNLLRLTVAGRYLIILQNNAELRGGGGFLGSFAVFDLEGRKPKRYYIESNIYKKDNEYNQVNNTPLPEFFYRFLDKNKAFLSLHDANFYTQFSDNASSIAKLYQLEYKDEVAGVIAVNASVIANLLKITGPINLPNYNLTISASNFFNVLSENVQQDYFTTNSGKTINEPKTILKDLLNPLATKLSHSFGPKLFFYTIGQIKQKQILFWFKDSTRQKIVEKNNWGGLVDPNLPIESVYTSSNNVAGGKTDINLDRIVELSGPSRSSRERELKLSFYHRNSVDFNTNTANNSYLKVFLSNNSRIISVSRNGQNLAESDFSIGQELGRTTVNFWVITLPSEQNQVVINYILSDKIDSRKILIQKQPGVISQKIKIKFNDKIIYQASNNQDKVI